MRDQTTGSLYFSTWTVASYLLWVSTNLATEPKWNLLFREGHVKSCLQFATSHVGDTADMVQTTCVMLFLIQCFLLSIPLLWYKVVEACWLSSDCVWATLTRILGKKCECLYLQGWWKHTLNHMNWQMQQKVFSHKLRWNLCIVFITLYNYSLFCVGVSCNLMKYENSYRGMNMFSRIMFLIQTSIIKVAINMVFIQSF